MRALWLLTAVLAISSAAADAGSPPVYAHGAARSSGVSGARSNPMPSGGRHNGWSGIGGGNRNPRWRGYAYPYRGNGVVYVVPYVQPEYAQPGYDQSDDDQTDDQQAGYFESPDVPQAAPAAPVSSPAAPAQTVQYVTSGQPVTVTPGARVTKGTLYKYTHDGINTYTNLPPPSGVGAKTLFSYTEVDAPVAVQTMYRCVDGKSQHVNYSSAPIPSLYCKAIGSDAPAVN